MAAKKSQRQGFVPPANTRYRYRDGTCVDETPGYHPHFSTRFVNWEAKVSPIVSKRELPELYLSRSECCGCTACAAVCPCDAIAMEPDEEGFAYPVVDVAQCVRCSNCMEVCVFKAAITELWTPDFDQ